MCKRMSDIYLPKDTRPWLIIKAVKAAKIQSGNIWKCWSLCWYGCMYSFPEATENCVRTFLLVCPCPTMPGASVAKTV